MGIKDLLKQYKYEICIGLLAIGLGTVAVLHLRGLSAQSLSAALLLESSDSKTAIITAIGTVVAGIIAALGALMRGFHEVRKLKVELASKNYDAQLKAATERTAALEKELSTLRKEVQTALLDAATCRTELTALRERYQSEKAQWERQHAEDQRTIAELRAEIETSHASITKLQQEQSELREALRARGWRPSNE